MTRIFSLCIFSLIFLLAACGGDSPKPTATSVSLPPALQTNRPSSGVGSLPPVAGTAASNTVPNTLPPFASAPTLPVAPGGSTDPMVTPQFVTDFSSLSDGERVNLSGRLELRPDESGSGQPTGILVDGQGKEVMVMMPPFMLLQMNGQEVELSGMISVPTAEGELPVLQVNSRENSTVPDFLAQQSTLPFAPGQSAPLPGANVTQSAPDVVANSQFNLLETSVTPNLSALQTYDALQASFAQDLTGKVWLSLIGNATLGWTFEFLTPATGGGTLYQVNADGSVLRREVPIVSEGILPIDRSRVQLDSPQVQERLGAEGASAILALRALDNGVIEWGAVGMDVPPMDATTP